MRAILILAGRSTRFWPLSEKSLFPIAGTCLLDEQIRRLRTAKVRSITLVAGAHNIDAVRKRYPSLDIVEQEDLDLGMRGALLSALPSCKEEPILVVSANDLVESHAYRALLDASTTMEGGGLLAQRVRHYFPGGYLSVQGKRITGIVEKPAPGTEPSDLVNIVAHVHISPQALLAALKTVRTDRDDGYEVALAALVQRTTYIAVPYEGSWHPVKYPWHLLDVLPQLLSKSGKPTIHPTARIHRTAVIEGPVIIGKNVSVFAHATIAGPAFIGDGAIVANNALVRDSSIGSGSVIGFSTEICRSILAENVWTHMNYVGDSIIGPDVSLGGGTTTGNLRLDEGIVRSRVRGDMVETHRKKFGVVIGQGCRIGANTTTAPGVKIGQKTFVASATPINEDLPDCSFVRLQPSAEVLEIRPNKLHANPSREELKKTLKEKSPPRGASTKRASRR